MPDRSSAPALRVTHHNQASRRDVGDAFGWTTCDGTGPFRFVEMVGGSARISTLHAGDRLQRNKDKLGGQPRTGLPRRDMLDPDSR